MAHVFSEAVVEVDYVRGNWRLARACAIVAPRWKRSDRWAITCAIGAGAGA